MPYRQDFSVKSSQDKPSTNELAVEIETSYSAHKGRVHTWNECSSYN